MNHWILQVNPNSFRLSQGSPVLSFQVGENDWWGISRYFKVIEPEETTYIWQAIDYRYPTLPKPRGIYTKAIIVARPPHSKQLETRIVELKKRIVEAGQAQMSNSNKKQNRRY